MSDDLWLKSLADLSDMIRSKAVSPVEVLDRYLARIAALDGQIHSVNALRTDAARAEAKQAETASLKATGAARCMASPSASKT